MEKRFIIVSGGHIHASYLKEELNNEEDYVLIAVDSGANYLYEINKTPNLLVGDFDSIDETVLRFFEQDIVNIKRFEPEKDNTDTDIALNYCIEKGGTNIIIYGGVGSRFDHSLANIFLLEKYCEKASITIKNENNEMELFRGPAKIKDIKKRYKYLSLIPLSDKVSMLTSEGLKYEVHNFDLVRADSRGISNEILGENCSLSFEEGLLLVIKSKDL